MVEATTKALLAKVRGNIQMNPADWAVSGLRTDSPIRAATHDRAMPKAMISTNLARAATGPVVIRKPSTMPTVRIARTGSPSPSLRSTHSLQVKRGASNHHTSPPAGTWPPPLPVAQQHLLHHPAADTVQRLEMGARQRRRDPRAAALAPQQRHWNRENQPVAALAAPRPAHLDAPATMTYQADWVAQPHLSPPGRQLAGEQVDELPVAAGQPAVPGAHARLVEHAPRRRHPRIQPRLQRQRGLHRTTQRPPVSLFERDGLGRDNLLKGTVCRRGQPVRVHLKAGEELLQVRPLDWTLVGGDRRGREVCPDRPQPLQFGQPR